MDYVPAVGHLDSLKEERAYPDVLRDLSPAGFELPARQNRCLWLTVRVPTDAEPGVYRGVVTVSESGGDTAAMPVELTVHNLTLPDPSRWSLRVDFWQSFGRLAKQYGVKEWSEEWWELVRVFLLDLAEHGANVVQVGRSHFDWTRGAEGQWQFGFERFDRYVELCGSAGMDGLIEYLQMFDGRADSSVHYTDAAGKPQSVKCNPGDPLFDEAWLAFAQALAKHCRERGWFERLYVCPTDEPQDVYGPPTLERFKHCVALLKQADEGHRTTSALDTLKAARELAPLLDRLVFKLREDVYNRAFAAELRGQGKLVEAYLCCHPDFPNSFITSEAIEQRAIGWLCWQEGLEGLLRWSYVNWPPDVWGQPAGDGKYAPGDLFIVYPGDRKPLASTRWERMREGFEDWEMLQQVERRIAKSKSGPAREAAQKAYDEAMAAIAGPRGKLTRYTRDPEALLEGRRRLLEAVERL